MVWTDPVSQDPYALQRLSQHYQVPILAIHAPCLIITQRVWTTDPWTKLQKAQFAAELLGAQTVVVHPPFRWQRDYARGFREGIDRLANETDVRFAVENMFPLRVRGREVSAYQPTWDVASDDEPYRDYTLDLSHTAVSQSDALAMLDAMGDRLAPPAHRRRHRPAEGRAPRPRPRQPAVRRGARAARRARLRRARDRRGQHPPRARPRRARGRPRRGAGVLPAAPGRTAAESTRVERLTVAPPERR